LEARTYGSGKVPDDLLKLDRQVWRLLVDLP